MALTQKDGTAAGPNPSRPARDWRRTALLTAGALGLAGSVYACRYTYRKEVEERYPYATAAGALFAVSTSLENHPEACDDVAYLSGGINYAKNSLYGESPVLRTLWSFPEFTELTGRLEYLSADAVPQAPSTGCDALGSELLFIGRELMRIPAAHQAEMEAAGAEIRAKYAPIYYCSAAGIALSVAAIAFGLLRKRKPSAPVSDDILPDDSKTALADPEYVWSTFKPDQKEADPPHSEEQGWVRKIENKR